MKKRYIYPRNMKTKPKLWLWSMRDVIIIGIAVIPAILAAMKLGFYLPAAAVAVYAFLTIRMEDQAVLDFIKRAVRFFITGQQFYLWKEDRRGGKENEQH